MRSTFYAIFAVVLLFHMGCSPKGPNRKDTEMDKPNIIFIYLDDLGYGDLGAYGATGIPTPHMDALSNGGVRFTQGYATSATCTPSRYGLLTGVYPWRNRDAKILPGTAPMLIGTNQMTIPRMLKAEGYHTAVVGKWHLGLGDGKVDWNQHISPNPNDVGFDYSYIMAATQDRVPTVYIKDGKVDKLDPQDPIRVSYEANFPGEPTGLEQPELTTMKWHHGHNNSIVNGVPRIGFMKGGESAKWKDIEMADHFLAEAKAYVRAHQHEPFFLYYAMQQPHVPRIPHPRFIGTTDLGPRGDVIVEADWCVGELVKTLEKEGLLENTLIVFSSDNGPVLNDGYYDEAVERLGDHQPTGGLRGGKYSMFEAGTKVPFITYWKGRIQPKTSDALVCQVDLFASLAKLVGSKSTVQDSQDLLNVFMGKSDQGRNTLVLEANTKTILRKDDWILIPPYQGAAVESKVNIELGNNTNYQLYNIKEDIGQQLNLAVKNPEKLQEMIETFEGIRGKDYQNNVSALELK
ncbi:sulfatase family protein [Persicobacter diffluens]|uniref:Arylsulfatase n=1 Tax=Persicobacter diffluens TaxID=981 RepID=A0AAN5APX2_9BACT|nr:arylsulfatase [Persicobacter diffluens]